eukprot:scaffold137334_cov51-Attheya_sp.AAC.5
MPALPRDVDPRDPLIIETLTSLEKGSITYDEACATIDEHVQLKVTSRGDVTRQDSEIEQSAIEKIAEHNDNEQNLVTLADAHDESSISDSKLRYLDSDPLLIARLDRIENLLERLLPWGKVVLDMFPAFGGGQGFGQTGSHGGMCVGIIGDVIVADREFEGRQDRGGL